MKAFRKLLAGSLLVALAAFGLTALTSSSTNSSYDTRVMAFLNETCNSLDLMLFQNLTDMLDFRGTKMDGVTWNFESYINVSDYEFTDNPACNLVSEIRKLPEVRVVKTKPKIIPADPSPGGGGGGGEEEETPVPPPEPEVEFDDQDLNELKAKWQGCSDQIGSKYGRFDLKFNLEYREETEYLWLTDLTDKKPNVYGETVHRPDKMVTIYPVSIENNEWDIDFPYLMMQTSLMEFIHTIQKPFDPLTDNKFDREVESFNLSHYWYKAIFNAEPPIRAYTDQEIKDAKTEQYLKDVARFKELEKKEQDGIELTAQEEQDLVTAGYNLAEHYSTHINVPPHNNAYESSSDLGCD
ncbi:MAG: hypothetical protein F4227_05070 [Gammaproteobacteria bacterium]|nr:hypothetical protein [Gammaproteobacteria bacterium]